MKHVVGLSGGKDSTALAFRLREVEPRDYIYICTPTGHELPEMKAWWERLEKMLGQEIVKITNHGRTLTDFIQINNALPNNRQRWCTRQLKIEPTIAWCVKNRPCINYVGLRADEDEREGIYGELVQSDFPFKRWGWGLAQVWGYLESIGLKDCIPDRTDCYDCYDQKIREWFVLWRDYPTLYEEACQEEDKRPGRTFRSPTRDTWPASLRELAKEFANLCRCAGTKRNREGRCLACKRRTIRGGVEPKKESCRVCRL